MATRPQMKFGTRKRQGRAGQWEDALSGLSWPLAVQEPTGCRPSNCGLLGQSGGKGPYCHRGHQGPPGQYSETLRSLLYIPNATLMRQRRGRNSEMTKVSQTKTIWQYHSLAGFGSFQSMMTLWAKLRRKIGAVMEHLEATFALHSWAAEAVCATV